MLNDDRTTGYDASEAELRSQLETMQSKAEQLEHIRSKRAMLQERTRDLEQRKSRLDTIGRHFDRLDKRMRRLRRDLDRGRTSWKELMMIRRRYTAYGDEARALARGDRHSVPRYRPWRTKLLKLLIVIGLLLCMVEFLGVPHLRTSYRYRGPSDSPTIISARYWSVTGVRDMSYTQMGDDMPLIAMLPLEGSVLDYGSAGMDWVWQQIKQIGGRSE